MVQCTTHFAFSGFSTVKPLFAPADSYVEMDRNENESAACAKGQRVCLCRLVSEEVKEPFYPTFCSRCHQVQLDAYAAKTSYTTDSTRILRLVTHFKLMCCLCDCTTLLKFNFLFFLIFHSVYCMNTCKTLLILISGCQSV